MVMVNDTSNARPAAAPAASTSVAAPAEQAGRLAADRVNLSTRVVAPVEDDDLLSRAVNTVKSTASDVKEYASDAVEELSHVVRDAWAFIAASRILSDFNDRNVEEEREAAKKQEIAQHRARAEAHVAAQKAFEREKAA